MSADTETDYGSFEVNLDNYGKAFKMPAPLPRDPTELGTRFDGTHLVVKLGKKKLRLSPWNAARLAAQIGLFLNIRIHPRDAKQLVLGPPREKPPGDNHAKAAHKKTPAVRK